MANPRNRVLDAINHIQPDRTPIDFGCHASSGIMAIAYNKLRNYLGLPKRLPKVYDLIQQLAIPDDDVLERFRVDVVDIGRAYCTEDKWWKEWRLPDGTACLIPSWADVRQENDHWYLFSSTGKATGVQKKGSLYFEQTYFPLEAGIPDDIPDLTELFKDVMWSLPKPPGPSVSSPQELRQVAKSFRNSTDKAIAVSSSGSMMGSGQMLCRIDNWLLNLAAEPDKANQLMDRVLELHKQRVKNLLDVIGPYVDIVVFADDMGMQTGPLVSQGMYREFFKPRHKALWNYTKQVAPVKVLLHSCGSIYPFLQDMIESGLDAINPIQTSCQNMDPARLKKEFGSNLCFFGGGCDTQTVLANSTPAQIREHVLKRLEIFAPQGGYVFNQIHNVMADIPPQNIVAVYDAAAEFNGT